MESADIMIIGPNDEMVAIEIKRSMKQDCKKDLKKLKKYIKQKKSNVVFGCFVVPAEDIEEFREWAKPIANHPNIWVCSFRPACL